MRQGRHTNQAPDRLILKDREGARLPVSDPTIGQLSLVPELVFSWAGVSGKEQPRLVWWLGKDYRIRPLGAGTLYTFLKLSQAGDSDILRFAEAWGPLGLCKHGLPVPHYHDFEAPCDLEISTEEPVYLTFDEQFEYGPYYREEFSWWRHYAAAMGSIWLVAYDLRVTGKETPWEIWQSALLIGDPGSSSSTRPWLADQPAGWLAKNETGPPPRERAPVILELIIGELVRVAGLEFRMKPQRDYGSGTLGFTPALTYQPYPISAAVFEDPPFTAPTPTLLSSLASRLLASLSLESDERRCSVCGNPFRPNRLRDDRAYYCTPECSNLGDSAKTAMRRRAKK